MRLSSEVGEQTLFDIRIQQRTLCDQRVNLFLGNFEGDSVDQQRNFDGVELTKHWIHFDVLSVQDLHVHIDQCVHLSDGQDVEVLMKEKELNFMEFG